MLHYSHCVSPPKEISTLFHQGCKPSKTPYPAKQRVTHKHSDNLTAPHTQIPRNVYKNLKGGKSRKMALFLICKRMYMTIALVLVVGLLPFYKLLRLLSTTDLTIMV